MHSRCERKADTLLAEARQTSPWRDAIVARSANCAACPRVVVMKGCGVARFYNFFIAGAVVFMPLLYAAD